MQIHSPFPNFSPLACPGTSDLEQANQGSLTDNTATVSSTACPSGIVGRFEVIDCALNNPP